MLPGIDGLEVCRRLRETGDIPVIMLTAKGSVNDRVVGLEAGPTTTSPSRSARASWCCGSTRCCVVRRSRAPVGGPVQSGDIVVDPGSRVVTRADERVAMTAREFDLLHHFVAPRRQGVLPRGPAARRLGLVVRRRLHRHRARTPPAREARDRPDPSGATRDRVGRRLPMGGGGVTHDEMVIVAIAAGCAASVGVVGLVVAWVVPRRQPPLAAGRRRCRGRRRRSIAAVIGHRTRDVHLRPRLRGGALGVPGRRHRLRVLRLPRGSRRGAVVAGSCTRARDASASRDSTTPTSPVPPSSPRSTRSCGRPPASWPRHASASSGSRSRAASWSPGSPTTCVRRSPACAR